MKALSLLQPWGSLIIQGHKKIETRPWAPKNPPKEILIHASIGKYYGTGKNKISCRELCYRQPFADLLGGGSGFDKLPFGMIIGKVEIDWIVQTDVCFLGNQFEENGKVFEITNQELAFGDYTKGRFAWLLSNPVIFKNPIPYKGSLSLWDFPDHLLPKE